MTTNNLAITPDETFAFSGYDSENITVVLLTPANQSEVSGTFDMTFNITSVHGPLNLTLFIEDSIYPDYNQTEIPLAVNATTTVNITVDTTTLSEGMLNFTLLFENNTWSPAERETYHLTFLINNHGPPSVKMISPVKDETLTGLSDIYLNITSDYSNVYLNITVDGQLDPDYNMTLVPATAANHTLNCSRYDNGEHTIRATVWTEEGLSASVDRFVVFLDYVRFVIAELTSYSTISGNQTIEVKTFSPYETVTISAYVDGKLAPDVANVTIHTGRDSFILNTTPYSEGEHNFTFIEYDGFGHKWSVTMVLIIDNYGVPEVSFVAPKEDIVVGVAQFTINIESKWATVNISVFVDGEPVPELSNVTANTGEYTFSLDTSRYTKWEHEITVKVVTIEGESAEVSQKFGFANIKPEEIVSLVVLLGIAFLIPIRRWRSGQHIKPVILMDVLFILVAIGVFLLLGVTSYSLMVWHFNLSSIWALGIALIFANWVFPLFEKEGPE